MSDFPLKTSSKGTTLEFPDPPMNFTTLMQLLWDQQYQGQILIDFHRGMPRVVSIPRMDRIPLIREKPPTA